MGLGSLPYDVFLAIVGQLVPLIGITKALRLRSVNKAFNEAILYQICIAQVIDLTKLSNGEMSRIPPSVLARIILASSRSCPEKEQVFMAVARVNRELDSRTQPASKEQRMKQHEMIAEAAARTIAPETIIVQRGRPWAATPGGILAEKTRRQNIISGAIIIGDLPLVKSLYAEWPDGPVGTNRRSAYFGKPLHIAAAWGRLEIVQYLLDNGADPQRISAPHDNDNDWRPNVESVCLWSRHVDRCPDGSALRAAALGGHEDVVRLLLQPQYIIRTTSPEYYRAILAATRGGYVQIIDLLLETADMELGNMRDFRYRMLIEAVKHRQEALVRMLLDMGKTADHPRLYKPRRRSSTPLHIAAGHNYTEIIDILLDHGAHLDARCESGFTPIETAARSGHEEAVEKLLEQGGKKGHWAYVLGAAAYGGQVHLVRHCLQKGVDVHATTCNCTFNCDCTTVGVNAMCEGIFAQNPTIIRMLFDAGVPKDSKSVYPPHGPMYANNMSGTVYMQAWIKELLVAMGIQPELPTQGYWSWHGRAGFWAARIERGLFVTKETWEWVGKY
ncbi:hypothetical protein FQN50_009679 [Emmonsiellopsis sp. PD_5]|nr:hypothetical protein FQN50_009679 [Emmonsiellopsis sp. PD_5]